jgi:hypothetical protein
VSSIAGVRNEYAFPRKGAAAKMVPRGPVLRRPHLVLNRTPDEPSCFAMAALSAGAPLLAGRRVLLGRLFRDVVVQPRDRVREHLGSFVRRTGEHDEIGQALAISSAMSGTSSVWPLSIAFLTTISTS